MAVFSIFTKELKHNTRNLKGMILMVLFPIILIVVLGTALSGMFDRSSEFKDIRVLYKDPGDKPLSQAFAEFRKHGTEMGITFTKTESSEQGVENIKNRRYTCFVNVSDEGLELTKTDWSALKANLVEAVLKTFVERYKTVAVVAQVNPQAVPQMIKNSQAGDFVQVSSLGEKPRPRAMDYYAITMLTLITLYSSLTGVYAIRNEKTLKTAGRLLCAPVGRYELLLGKALGALFITLIQVLVVLLFSKYLLKTYWGEHLGTIFLLVSAEVVMAVSLGIGVAFLLRSEAAISGVLNMVIPILVFFGGGYIPLDGFNKTVLLIANASPLRWINTTLMAVIYANDFSSVAAAIGFNLGLGAVFLSIAAYAIRREGALL